MIHECCRKVESSEKLMVLKAPKVFREDLQTLDIQRNLFHVEIVTSKMNKKAAVCNEAIKHKDLRVSEQSVAGGKMDLNLKC